MMDRSREKNKYCGIHDVSDPNKLAQWFVREFSVDNFFAVFYWARPILSIEKSTPRGIWYLKRKFSVYIPSAPRANLIRNLCQHGNAGQIEPRHDERSGAEVG